MFPRSIRLNSDQIIPHITVEQSIVQKCTFPLNALYLCDFSCCRACGFGDSFPPDSLRQLFVCFAVNGSAVHRNISAVRFHFHVAAAEHHIAHTVKAHPCAPYTVTHFSLLRAAFTVHSLLLGVLVHRLHQQQSLFLAADNIPAACQRIVCGLYLFGCFFTESKATGCFSLHCRPCAAAAGNTHAALCGHLVYRHIDHRAGDLLFPCRELPPHRCQRLFDIRAFQTLDLTDTDLLRTAFARQFVHNAVDTLCHYFPHQIVEDFLVLCRRACHAVRSGAHAMRCNAALCDFSLLQSHIP